MNNRWATFPSASVAWRISEEPFVKKAAIFDDLKLRRDERAGSVQTVRRLLFHTTNRHSSCPIVTVDQYGLLIVKSYMAIATIGRFSAPVKSFRTAEALTIKIPHARSREKNYVFAFAKKSPFHVAQNYPLATGRDKTIYFLPCGGAIPIWTGSLGFTERVKTSVIDCVVSKTPIDSNVAGRPRTPLIVTPSLGEYSNIENKTSNAI